jgi:glycosyltransferase involved in cell wall biosynthesis
VSIAFLLEPFSDASQKRWTLKRSIANKPRATRVSFLIDNLSRAGTENQLLALIRNLDRSIIEPSLVLLDGDNDVSRSLEPDCPVLRLGVRKLLGLRGAKAALRLSRFWKQQRPDVAQIYFLDSVYFGVPVAKICGIRKIVRVRNNLGYWLTRKHRMLNRLLRPWIDVTITNSDSGRAALVEQDGATPDRVAVIENGVDLSLSSHAGDGLEMKGSPLVIGCVANLRPVKNVAGFVRAAKLVLERHPEVRFEIAGDGEQRNELESLRDSLGLGNRFIFRGSVADVPGFLRRVSIAVLPSHSEGMSNAILEYMAAGKAIVATNVGANRSVLGETGLIVPPGDDQALADAICDFIECPVRTCELGMAARTRVEVQYSRAAMCRRFEEFYRSLVTPFGGKNPASPSKTSYR